MSDTVGELLQRYWAHRLSQVIDYDKFNRYAITHHSTRIEGSTLTETETQVLLDDSLTPKGKPLKHSLMAQDHYRALLFVIQQAETKVGISAELVQHTGNTYNTALGTVDASRGEFRKGNVTAGGTYFVNYDKVEPLTTKLVAELSASLPKSNPVSAQLELSFAAHFNLVTIHPFYDGNGHTSRLLMNFIQVWHRLPLVIVFSEDRADYFDALQQARQQEDVHVFYAFMYHQYEKHLRDEINKYEAMLNNRSSGGHSFSLLF